MNKATQKTIESEFHSAISFLCHFIKFMIILNATHTRVPTLNHNYFLVVILTARCSIVQALFSAHILWLNDFQTHTEYDDIAEY